MTETYDLSVKSPKIKQYESILVFFQVVNGQCYESNQFAMSKLLTKLNQFMQCQIQILFLPYGQNGVIVTIILCLNKNFKSQMAVFGQK